MGSPISGRDDEMAYYGPAHPPSKTSVAVMGVEREDQTKRPREPSASESCLAHIPSSAALLSKRNNFISPHSLDDRPTLRPVQYIDIPPAPIRNHLYQTDPPLQGPLHS
ncbi:unnamed protein product [Zymoseptoria tritici ST99CH_3D7]|uniref:Uncharacterized protein n=1 Tax=Zymoseptoria tritici (strain ST99CH_3D7) TaxID=1276538 RepID=A0A1X7RI08_ZYMT9|nr:unnamed protein product [Zymoseptoria tritici ST99CH_3D7]